jgi:NAD-dependent deacetylase
MGGLWRDYDVTKVASSDAWANDPELVLEFYNARRKVAFEANPNNGHLILADLENEFEVIIITQNVDNLHERAGSSAVLHLHGNLFESRSTDGLDKVFPIKGNELNIGDLCPNGSQLRPNVVWFGEPVPAFQHAINLTRDIDLFVIVGTSLQVYPAAGLIDFVPEQVPKWVIDPQDITQLRPGNMTHIKDIASRGLARLKEELRDYL